MTSLSLRQIVEKALADVGADPALASRPKGRARTTTWLGGESGLGIRHYPSGRHVYVVQTRMAGRMRTVTIGPANVITRYQASSVARRVLAHALVGHDPATTRQRIRSAPSMDDFIQEYWEKCAASWKPSTQRTAAEYRRNSIDGAFPELHVDSLAEADVAKWFAALTDRAGPGAANRSMDILRAALNKAEQWGYRLENTNPCRHIRLNRKVSRTRHLSELEMTRLGRALADLRNDKSQVLSAQATAITLLLLTGCRRSEVLGLQWPDLRGGRLRLRDSKTGPRTVWLGSEALDLLAGHPRYPKVSWIFWNLRLKKPMRDLQSAWAQARDAACLRDFRLHDLRHTFASHAAMGKESLPMIGRLLGHTKVASTARYAHFDDSHLLEAADLIGCAIERALGLQQVAHH
jgi:integrase